MNQLYREALALIEQYDIIILHRHKMPDGDAIGSQLGLRNLLKHNYPKKQIYMVGDASERFSFLPDSAPETVPDELFPRALCIILDSGAQTLVADTRWNLAAATLRFDHHIFQEKIAQLEIIDDSFESACGLLTDFALNIGLALSPESALPLYMGMVTDSGRFRYDSTTPRTHRLAAELLSCHLDTDSLFTQLYATSLEDVQRRAQFALRIQFTPGGIAYLYNSAQEISRLNMELFDVSRGMVGVMGDLKGVEIWANFTEAPQGILAELRSRRIPVRPVAAKYGGGGHAKACGATLKSREDAEAMLKDLDILLGEAQDE